MHWRVPTKLIDDAMKARASTESLNAQAARLGLSKYEMLKRLRASGATRVGHRWALPREEARAAA
jgi:hypothetical protein